MRTAGRLIIAAAAVAVVALPAVHAAAQMPWPGDPPPGGGAAPPWPGSPGAQPMAPPMTGGIGGGGMGGGSMSGGGMGGGGMGGGGGMPPCMAEFAKLREEVERRGKLAKAAGQRAAREEMCKNVTSFAEAESKWVKYTEANVQNCQIPVQIVNQLKQMHSNTEQAKQRICNAPAAAGPSLSDALGTTRFTPDPVKIGNGTLDTLTGPAIR